MSGNPVNINLNLAPGIWLCFLINSNRSLVHNRFVEDGGGGGGGVHRF